MNFLASIRTSIFPGSGSTAEGPQGERRYFRSLLLHFRPRVVPERTLRITLTWGLGGMAVVLVFLLFGTGLLLKFAYEPFPDRAYDSILNLQNNVAFGQLIRNLHHWSGNILLLIVFLHFLRVFFTGAFTKPRQFNWIIGLMLFGVVVLSNFTGYLLPWDQLAYWAVTVSSSMLEYIPGFGDRLQKFMLGGNELGPQSLTNFYAIHTAVLPALLLCIMPFHFWRIRKANGLVIPRTPDEDPGTSGGKVEAIPNLIVREVSLALVLLAAILVLAMLNNAPLGAKANPGLSPNPTKAPWYFMGLQELLMHFQPLFALFIIPLFLVLSLLGIPYVNSQADTAGVWFCSAKGRKLAVICASVAVLATVAGVLADEFMIGPAQAEADLVGIGLMQLGVTLAGCIGLYVVLKKKFAATTNEAIQSLFVLLVTSFVVLTIIGIWFRGEGMKLVL